MYDRGEAEPITQEAVGQAAQTQRESGPELCLSRLTWMS